MREQPLGTAGGIVILILVLVSIFADGLAPYRYQEIHLRDRLQGSSAQYLLGTDHAGRDFLSRLIHGARMSLTVGLAATALTVVVAVLIGGTTGFIGGRLDLVTQRFVDAWMAFPGLLLLLTIMSIAGRGMPQIIIVLGVSGGIPASRVVRGAVLAVKENAYFQAAQAIGSSRRRSLLRHVLPNIAAPIIIIFSINVGGVIMSEAALSFLGFGLPANIPSWGGMLSREGRRYMEVAPHLALWPGLCLTVVVYSLNMFGDAVRDLLGPPPARPPRALRRGPGRIVADPERMGQKRQTKRRLWGAGCWKWACATIGRTCRAAGPVRDSRHRQQRQHHQPGGVHAAHVRSPEHGTQPPIARSRPPFVSKWPSPDGEYAEQEPHEPQARNRV